ncbi:MAG: hypothetical protein IPN44_06365 [Flavobacteriales bacterium]|nr:hypothetical protein [Flavobacteriales bacterium]
MSYPKLTLWERMRIRWSTEGAIAVLMLLFMLILSLLPALQAVRGLEFGPTMDFYRDGSFVHSILDGRSGQDPQFKGEHLWYTPLIFGLEALLVRITGMQVETLLVQAGPWLNLLAPVCFFIMAWYFRGPVAAVAATAIYLFFLIGDEPAWAVPTYTPWLIPISFVQGFFYLALIALHRSFRSGTLLRAMGIGALTGVIFLSHAAPALILVVMIAMLTFTRMIAGFRAGKPGLAWERLGLSAASGILFLVCSMPLLWFIMGYYNMRMVNRAPFLFTYELLTVEHIRLFLFYNITWVTFAGLAGLVLLVREVIARGGLRRKIELYWFSLTVLLFGYAYFVSVMDTKFGVVLPGTAPSFHYFFYMKAAMVLQAGALVAYIAARLPMRKAQGRTIAMLFWVLPIAVVHPGYSERMGLYGMRVESLAISENSGLVAMFHVLREKLVWDDVVLCDDDLSVFPLMPSARKAVATVCTMANPYVDLTPRTADRDSMMAGLRIERPDEEALLEKYDVTHLLVRTSDEAAMPLREKWFPIVVSRNERYVLFAR